MCRLGIQFNASADLRPKNITRANQCKIMNPGTEIIACNSRCNQCSNCIVIPLDGGRTTTR